MKHVLLTLVTVLLASFQTLLAQTPSNNPNDYAGADSDRIQAAVNAAPLNQGVVHIPARRPDDEANRDYWLLDRAILLPANTTIYFENCTVKLSDKCRDNFIRSANAGIGIEKVEAIENLRVIGIGKVEFFGADHPRATGDSAKTLGVRTYGTDAGKEGESQTGDWRNIGLLFVKVRRFQVENIAFIQAHAWSLSFEKCSEGVIRHLRFEADETREIDGRMEKVLNVDGVDLRKGCHNIVIDGISGHTGDDLVAITAINPQTKSGGQLQSTEVCDYSEEEDLSVDNIVIRNVNGYAAGGHQIVRLLNASGIKLSNVIIDGVVDSSPVGVVDRATIRIGDSNPAWGGVTPLGDASAVIVRNVASKARHAVLIAGSLTDSIITNVVNYSKECRGLTYESGEENVKNVLLSNWTDIEP
ncbi:MAG: hypothetical protein Q4G03_05685 [Planctomycetia bacterium]|nr:hypothetical protein [Planctomycetia bacterium]